MGGFIGSIGGGCVNPIVEEEEPPSRTGMLGMLDMLQGWWWHNFLLLALTIDCGVMTWAAFNDEVVADHQITKITEADLSNWSSLPLMIANAHYIFCWLLFVDATLRLFTFVIFSFAKTREQNEEDESKGMLVTAAENVGSLAYKTVMVPFTQTSVGKWEVWQCMVYNIANITTRVMEFMVPACFDFLLSGIALFNAVPGLPYRRDLSVLNAYLAKVILSLLNGLVITQMVKNFLGADETFEEKLQKKYASRSDSAASIIVPWVPPLISFSVGFAFIITQHLEHSAIFFILGGLFILRGLLRGSPRIREVIANCVTLMVILVVFAQFAYNCAEYDGALGFDVSSGGSELVNEFSSDCCNFPPPPHPQPKDSFMCDSRCSVGASLVGCDADGINEDCRFCGVQGMPACAAVWLGSFRGLFAVEGMPHEMICSHFRLLGMLLILVQAVTLVLEAIFFGEVALLMKDDEDLSSHQRWTLAWIAEVLYQPYAGYEVLCYDMGIFAVALCHQFNIRIPIEVVRLARYFCYKTRVVIPWAVQQIWPSEMKKLIKTLQKREATYYAERADWYVRSERIADASKATDWEMESQIETVPFS